MDSQQQSYKPLYPKVEESNPERNSPFVSAATTTTSTYPYPSIHDLPPVPTATAPPASSIYPTVEMGDLVGDLFHPSDEYLATLPHSPDGAPLAPPPVEETLIRVPGAILHLIDRQHSVELASGDFSAVALRQGDSIVAVLARVGDDDVQWPLAKDEAAVRLDASHYFFSLHVPHGDGDGNAKEKDTEADLLNYGLTFASKGQEALLRDLDAVLDRYSSFSVQSVAQPPAAPGVLDGSVARDTAPVEVVADGSVKKKEMEREASAYWTTLAPNVEDYSHSVARLIAKGSGKLIKGILWCGDVTVDRLKWGNELMKKKISKAEEPSEISPQAMKRIQRAKRMTKMSEKVANGILSGVVKVSGSITSSIVNSTAGKKFFSLIPGEIILATLDGFGKICDAVEVSGKSVMATSSTVTTELVSHRYGEKAAEATHEGLDAAGHAIGTAWAVFKIRKALNPKSAIKPTSLAKSAVKTVASDLKGKK